ncbi:transcription antitermination factor NusB [Phnomibacter ginsenosidimutans]|uniref:Transcription antitermination protein NusB n=1 Tax=Phnomibacter ginsenosidimutans TaxID=2676868 RepID=A0A6I6GJA4_9BACT|nr:transcription antitermination factor NusB [Phnomibacter ginsenosidimutans]QGW27748.1 transcription antitermination factor NusB [Phnomibacter ginsenosidimutans]
MISRRNIRVKVMQCLYALRTGNELPFPSKVFQNSKKPVTPAASESTAEKLLRRQFDYSISLFIYQVWFLTEVARYAETDARNRAAKHLPTAEDLSVPVKIAGNELLWRILESSFYKDGVEQYQPSMIEESQEWIKKTYNLLTQSTPYAVYNSAEGREKKSEKEILEFIYNDLMLANEDWVSFIEELYTNWDDDAEMLQLLMLHYLQKPGVFQLKEMIGQEKFVFACQLLDAAEKKKTVLDEWITPKLRNWDADRLAQLDMILLELGVAEFLFFETIPPKVTINEYIDLAKAYSTNQSGQFVNGILDNIRKELEAAGKMEKVAFKK